ncbi:MAG: low-complexity tail membrane protein [Oscillatoriales cyanobacterium SM2_1_8]|nr:low-complexity tail membrane protein [Oscillatoriales cyanobacterium SM2_1_8]
MPMSNPNLRPEVLAPGFAAKSNETVLLWVQVALAAGVPLALVFCQLGLAVGDPVLPPALEIFALGAVPIAGVTWVQWWRPWYPFGTWVQHQPPETLTERQRRWLGHLLPAPSQPWWHPHGWLAVVTAGFVYGMFRQLYFTAPAVEAAAFLPPFLRWLGVTWSVIWLGVATALLQTALGAARLLIWIQSGGDRVGRGRIEVLAEQVKTAFTLVGQAGGGHPPSAGRTNAPRFPGSRCD